MMKPYFPSVIDSSMLATYKSCPTKFFYNYILELKPRELSVHLHAGKSFARGLEVARRAFYEDGQSTEVAESLGLGALLEAYGDFQCPADSAKSAERTAGAYEYYFSNYPLNEEDSPPITMAGGRRGIEFTFAHPLPILHPITGDPLLYSGAMDAILSFAGGTYICDEKTTTQLGSSWSRQWDLRSQFTAYCWGAHEAGIKVDGALVRGVSILKTKYETQQAITYRPLWLINQWYVEMLDSINEIIECWKAGKWRHNFDSACADYGGCAFRDACRSENPTPYLETGFERRHWDPLTRTESLIIE